MSFLFGGQPPTVTEMARRFKTDINRQIREMQREGAKLEAEEKTLFAELKKHADVNPKVALQKAAAIVRVRRLAARFATMQGNLQGVNAKISTIKSMDALTNTIGSVNALMSKFSASPALTAMPKTMANFARENQALVMKTELMDDTLEDIFDENENEECSDLVADIFMQAGLQLPRVASVVYNEPEDIEKQFERLKLKHNI